MNVNAFADWLNLTSLQVVACSTKSTLVGLHLIDSCQRRTDEANRFVKMNILCTLYLRRGLAPPFWLRTLLVQSCIDPYKVDEVEVDGLSLLIDGPRDVNATTLIVIGVGIIDARRLFGMKSVKNTSRIDLVVDLEAWDDTKAYERMGIDEEDISILGVNVPLCTVPVSPGRNLAVIIEVAAINNRQKKMGYNSAKELLSNLGMLDEENDNKPTDLDVWHNA